MCNDDPVNYDTSSLAKLGRRRERLVAQLDEVDKEILPEVVAAKAAKVPEERIAALAGVTRQTVRNWLRRERERTGATEAAPN